MSALTILEEEEGAVKIIRTAAKTAEIIADAVLFARDIVSTPANEMTPTRLANEAMESAREKEHPVHDSRGQRRSTNSG